MCLLKKKYHIITQSCVKISTYKNKCYFLQKSNLDPITMHELYNNRISGIPIITSQECLYKEQNMEEMTGKIPSIVDRGKKMIFGINIIYSITSDSFLV